MRDDLTPEQEDGLACVECGAVWNPGLSVGYSRTGAQVFACLGACYDQATAG